MSQLSPHSLPPTPQTPSHLQPLTWLHAFWKFSRPHTIIGTSLSVMGMYLIAIATAAELNGLQSQPLGSLVLTLMACLCGNVYIVGLNQLEDIAIDRINKPDLPLAAGDFSRRMGQVIVGVTGLLALAIAAWQGSYLLGMVSLSLAIGTAYSLPPIRLKRYPFWASLCIFTVRGIIVNLGLFLHFTQILGQPTSIPATVWALTGFILVFTFAIAIFKDIPDLEGDRQYNISTLTIRLGSRRVFQIARWVLTLCYGGMILAAFWPLPGINGTILGWSHSLLLIALWVRSQTVNLQARSSIAQFYQFIWKLFFLEYLLFPAACLLS